MRRLAHAAESAHEPGWQPECGNGAVLGVGPCGYVLRAVDSDGRFCATLKRATRRQRRRRAATRRCGAGCGSS